MEFFATLPFRKYIDKQIAITDLNHVQVGFFRRMYKSKRDKLINYLPLSFLETRNIAGESDGNHLTIIERSFKENLTRLKWDVYFNNEDPGLLEDKTKISTNQRMVYHKNNHEYIFKKDAFNNICKIISDGVVCAEIKMEKKIPASLKISMNNNELTNVELLGIYYILYLVY